MKKFIVLLTLCCIVLLCIGYPLFNKISSSKDKIAHVSETSTNDTKDSPEITDAIDNDTSAAETSNTSDNTTATETYDNSNTTLESNQENPPVNIEIADDTDQGNAVEESQNNSIQTVEAYVLSVNGTTMYVDLENSGARTYPGEGEDRQTAFDISNAEQIQTEISDVYPESNHFIRSCVSVEIEYYTENGVNIVTKLTSNGQEIAPLYFKD